MAALGAAAPSNHTAMAGRWLTIIFPVVCTFQLHRRYALQAEKAQVHLTTTRSGVAPVIESIAETALPVINPATVPVVETVQEIISPVTGPAVETAKHVILPARPPLEFLNFATSDPVDFEHAKRVDFLWELFYIFCAILPVINYIRKAYVRSSKVQCPAGEALATTEEVFPDSEDAHLHDAEAEITINTPQSYGSPEIAELDDTEPIFVGPRPASCHPRTAAMDSPEELDSTARRPPFPTRVFIPVPYHVAGHDAFSAPNADLPIRTMMLLVTQFLTLMKTFMAENGLDHLDLEGFCCCYLTGDRSLLDLPALYRELSIDTPWTRFGSVLEDFRKDHAISQQILRDLLKTYLDRHTLFFGVVGFINEEKGSDPCSPTLTPAVSCSSLIVCPVTLCPFLLLTCFLFALDR